MSNRQASAAMFFMGVIALVTAIFTGDGTVWMAAAVLFAASIWQSNLAKKD